MSSTSLPGQTWKRGSSSKAEKNHVNAEFSIVGQFVRHTVRDVLKSIVKVDIFWQMTCIHVLHIPKLVLNIRQLRKRHVDVTRTSYVWSDENFQETTHLTTECRKQSNLFMYLQRFFIRNDTIIARAMHPDLNRLSVNIVKVLTPKVRASEREHILHWYHVTLYLYAPFLSRYQDTWKSIDGIPSSCRNVSFKYLRCIEVSCISDQIRQQTSELEFHRCSIQGSFSTTWRMYTSSRWYRLLILSLKLFNDESYLITSCPIDIRSRTIAYIVPYTTTTESHCKSANEETMQYYELSSTTTYVTDQLNDVQKILHHGMDCRTHQ